MSEALTNDNNVFALLVVVDMLAIMKMAKKVIVLIVTGLLLSIISPVLELTLIGLDTAPSVVRAQSITKDEAVQIVTPYKANLRSLGDYITGDPIYDQDPNDPKPIVISVPPDVNSGLPNLQFTLRPIEGVRVSALPDNPETDEDDSFVTNIFYNFELTQPARDISLIMDPNGLGSLYLGADPDLATNNQRFFGNTEDCIASEPGNSDKLVLKLIDCMVGAGVGADEAGNARRWENFAKILIPSEIRPSSCPLSTVDLPASQPVAASTNFGVNKAYAVAPLVIAGAWVGARWCLTRAIPFLAKGAIRWGGVALTGAVTVLKKSGTAVLGFFKKHPWVALLTVGGAILVATECGLGAITALTDGIGAMFVRIIGCFLEYVFNEFNGVLEPYLKSTAEYSLLPERSPPNYFSISVKNYFIGTAQAGLGSFESELKNKDSTIVVVWTWARSLIDIIVVIALLAIAFANILHLNISTYAAKKALPGLVIGVVGANASLLIIRFLADVTQAVSNFAADFACDALAVPVAKGLIAGCESNLVNLSAISYVVGVAFPAAILKGLMAPLIAVLVGGTAVVISTGTVGAIVVLIIAVVLLLYYFFLILAFIFVLFKRIIILYFLVMVSPLAFVAYGIPSFQQYFSKWWDYFFRFLFLFPIILFGMAVTIRLAAVIGVFGFGSLTDVITTPGIASIILVLSAATMVLKLPKMVTKGALDAGAMFKKAISAAPALVAGGQSAHGYFNKKKIAGLDQKYRDSKKLGNRKDAAGFLRQRRSAERSGKKWQGRFGALRGGANIFGRPEETIKTAWEARQKAGKGSDMLESAKFSIPGTGLNLLDTVKGKDAAYKDQFTRLNGAEELGRIRNPAQLKQWISKQPLKLQDKYKQLYEDYDRIRKVEGDEKALAFIADIGGAKTNDDIVKALSKSSLDTKDLASVTLAGLAGSINKAMSISGQRDASYTSSEKLDKFELAGAPFGGRPSSSPASSSGSSGGGTSTVSGTANGGGGGGSASSFRGSMAADQAAHIKEEAAATHKDTFTNLTKQYRDVSEEIDVAKNQDQVNIIKEKLNNIHSESLRALGDTLTQEGQDKLTGMRGLENMSQDAVRQMVENTSAAMDMGVHAGNAFQEDLRQNLQQTVGAAHNLSVEAESVNREVTKQFDAGELAEILNQQGTAQIDGLVNKLGPQIDRLTKAAGRQPDPALNRQLLQTLANSINAPGSKSLLGGLKSSFGNFGSTIVKQLGLNQISTSNSIATRISQAEKVVSPTENISNVTNVNQSTTVETATPPAIPSVPQHPPQTESQEPSDQTTGSNPSG